MHTDSQIQQVIVISQQPEMDSSGNCHKLKHFLASGVAEGLQTTVLVSSMGGDASSSSLLDICKSHGARMLRVEDELGGLEIDSLDLSRQAYSIHHVLLEICRDRSVKRVLFLGEIYPAFYCLQAKLLSHEYDEVEFAFHQDERERESLAIRFFGFRRSEYLFLSERSEFLKRRFFDADFKKSKGANGATIAVVLTHRDRPNFLREALLSLSDQVDKPDSVIVVDDGSRPEHKALVQELTLSFSDRLNVKNLFLQQVGAGEARNQGVANSDTTHVVFMDDDNLAEKDEIQRFRTAFAREPSSIVVPCFLKVPLRDSEGPIKQQLYVPVTGPPDICLMRNYMGDSNFGVSRSIFERSGGFSAEEFIGEDWEYLYRASCDGESLLVLPFSLFRYRIHLGQRSNGLLQDKQSSIRALGKRQSALAGLSRKSPPEELSATVRALSDELFFTGQKSQGSLVATRCIANLGGKDLLKHILSSTPEVLEAKLDICENVLRQITIGNDPRWLLSLKNEGPIQIAIHTFSRKPIEGTIYYLNKDYEEFNESCAVRFETRVSASTSWVSIEDQTRRGPLRFDLGVSGDEFYILGIDIYVERPLPQGRSLLTESFLNFATSSLQKNSNERFWMIDRYYSKDEAAVEGAIWSDVEFTLRSMGPDPRIHFSSLHASSRVKCRYHLIVEFDSSVPSDCRVYYSFSLSNVFVEEHSHAKKVDVGENLLIYALEFDLPVLALRIDPLSCPGEVVFKRISLEEI